MKQKFHYGDLVEIISSAFKGSKGKIKYIDDFVCEVDFDYDGRKTRKVYYVSVSNKIPTISKFSYELRLIKKYCN
jgi:transcription antitermination factor NusG